MPKPDDRPASEVYAVIEEPTSQMGPIRTILHKVMAPFGGQLAPGGTHPVVVERATGKKVRGSVPSAAPGLFTNMQVDLENMSDREFHNRYLDL